MFCSVFVLFLCSVFLKLEGFQDEYDELCTMVNAIAHPLAPRKVAKKIYKLIKKV